MNEIVPTITIEIGDSKNNVYPLRLIDIDENLLAEESIAETEFDRTNWQKDPIELMLSSEEDSAFLNIGTKLYSLIHQGEVGKKWDEFTKNKPACRTLLRILPDEVFNFPWELTCIDKFKRLSVNSDQTFIRSYQSGVPKLIDESSCVPLRVLIVIGASQTDIKVLAEDEIREIEKNIRNNVRDDTNNRLVHRLIDLEKLWNPTLDDLKNKLNNFQPHIFHFIGHGEVDGNTARLIINSAGQKNAAGQITYQKTEWNDDSIYADFDGWNWVPRLVLLNSCRTETTVSSTAIWSLGKVFRALGVPATIAMQADISGTGAGIFSGTLYKHLVQFDLLDTALGQARNALKTHVMTFENREWAIPVLTVSMPPEKILPFKLKVDETRIDEIRNCPDLSSVYCFANRIQDRRKLIQSLYQPTNIFLKDLIIIRGKQDSGKSWISKFCLEVLALLNFDVRYVPVEGSETLDWLEFLLQIRDGNVSSTSSIGSLIRQPLKSEAFFPFNWMIKQTKLNESPVWDGTAISARKTDVMDKSNWTPDFIEKTFASFNKSLLNATEHNKPLVIVFDSFPQKDNGFFQTDMTNSILEYLLKPLVKGEFKQVTPSGQIQSVKFIFVLRDEQFESYQLGTLAGKFTDFQLGYLSVSELKSCLEEYTRYYDPNKAKELIPLYLMLADAKYGQEEKIPPAIIKQWVEK